MTPSPNVTILGTTGRASFLGTRGSGGVVYENQYGTWWEFWEPPKGVRGFYKVWRIQVKDDAYAAFQFVDVTRVAKASAIDAYTLHAAKRSMQTMARVAALEAAVAYYGPSEFDPKPLLFTRKELGLRWPSLR